MKSPHSQKPDKTYEISWFHAGYRFVAGIDEAGRGPLAGPVTAASVMFDREVIIPGVNDSKKLSPARREALYDTITAQCLAFAVVFADEADIERMNILQATRKAMTEAALSLAPVPEVLLVDAVTLDVQGMKQQAIVKGDQICFSIAAASILAKVARDRYMTALDVLYPQYGFARHKGYGTADHMDALRRYGPCPAHRALFIRSVFADHHR
jgi:ribonuclease HII